MHKKTLVATHLALAGWLGITGLAQAQSKVELWGVVDAAVRHTNNEGATRDSQTKMIGGGMSQSRFGINVEEDLGGGSKALASLEHRFNLDTGEKDTAATPYFQLSYLGLQGPYGRLTMGRQWNVLFDVVSSTYASFPYSPYMDAYKPELGMAAGARSSNSLKYTLSTPSRNWTGTLQYSFAEGNKTDALENAVIGQVLGGTPPPAAIFNTLSTQGPQVAGGALKTVGGFVRYSEHGVSLGGGFLRTELPGGSDLDAWTVGGSYRTGPLYVNLGYGLNKIKRNALPNDPIGALRGTVRNQLDQLVLNSMWGSQVNGSPNGGFQAGDADKRQMVKVGFGYQITPQVNAGLHYFHAKQSGSVAQAYNGKANFMIAAIDYAFSKRTDAYFAVDHTRVSGGSGMSIDSASQARTRTGITTGIRHRF